MQKLHYQDFIIDQITHILNSKTNYFGNLNSKAFTYTIKSGMIDKYSNTYYDENNPDVFMNMWWDDLGNNKIDSLKDTLLISKQAYNILGQKKSISELKKILHFEHITPMSYTYNKLINLYDEHVKNGYKTSRDEVKKCFEYAKVILITKDESDILDKTKLDNTEMNKFIDYIEKYNAIIDPAIKNEAKNLVGSSLQRNGSGMLRVLYLIYNGVIFVNQNGNIIDEKEILRRVKEFDFRLHCFSK